MSATEERIPVIVGIGETVDRPPNSAQARGPVQMMADALRLAQEDAHAHLLQSVDSIDVIDVRSWGYEDLPGAVCERLGIQPMRRYHTAIGGEVPIRSLRDMARSIVEGRSRVAALCGGEATASVQRAGRAGESLPWPAQDVPPRATAWSKFLHPRAVALNLMQPVHVYPLYENACRASWGQTFEEGQQESAGLLSRMSRVAASNPAAWIQEPASCEQIAQASPRNRLVNWPYTKLMVANPQVNQGSALLMTSLAEARRLGVSQDRLIFVWGGVGADELRDFASRDRFDRSTAMNVVLESTSQALDRAGTQARFVDLYSCFPCVPKMARRVLGLDLDQAAGVAGGLTFFGAPLSNYMGHASCAMVRTLRRATGSATGLLYGQGEHVTKHQALVLGKEPAPAHFLLPDDREAARRVAEMRGASPAILDDFQGPARVETYTVMFGREGERERGVIVARTDDGSRVLVGVRPEQDDTLRALLDPDAEVVGRRGHVEFASGVQRWHF